MYMYMYIAIDISYHAADEKKIIFLLKRDVTVHSCTCDSHCSCTKLPFRRENGGFLAWGKELSLAAFKVTLPG